ncbi:MAG: ACP phosphodiesterase [Pseudomonadota bacterium]
MNFLAHALLSEPYAYSLIGNVSGDFVKGTLASSALHPRVIDGVRRHRRIDVLTDAQPQYRYLRGRFQHSHRRYHGLVLDVLLDHLLLKHWDRISSWKPEAFIEATYQTLHDHRDLLPPAFSSLLPRMIAADWLRAPLTVEGLERSVYRLSQRLKKPVDLVSAIPLLLNDSDVELRLLRAFSEVQWVIEDARSTPLDLRQTASTVFTRCNVP